MTTPNAQMPKCKCSDAQMPNPQMLKCQMLRRQMLKSTNAQIYKCSNAEIHQYSNALCSNAQMLKSTNAHMLNCQMPIPIVNLRVAHVFEISTDRSLHWQDSTCRRQQRVAQPMKRMLSERFVSQSPIPNDTPICMPTHFAPMHCHTPPLS